MAVFISYARNDRPSAETLRGHIETPRREVWLDERLTGGQNWWDTILSRIRECDVFIYALSLDSLDSRACQAELKYAQDLGRPILPVMVAQVAVELAPRSIAELQIVDYTTASPDTPVSLESALSLRNALDEMPSPGGLPDPLPDPPPAPISYMDRERELIDREELSYGDQASLVATLGQRLDRKEHRPAAMELLRRLRERPDVAQRVAKDIDALLPEPPKPPAPRPASRLSAELHPAVRRSRSGAQFELEARNHGDMDITATLAVPQESGAVSLEVDPGKMDVAPGETNRAEVRVKPRALVLVGRRRKHPVRVAIGSDGSDPLVVEAAFEQEPWVRLPWLAIGGLLVAVLLVVLALTRGSAPGGGVLTSDAVLKGEYDVTVRLATDVTGADTLGTYDNMFWVWKTPNKGDLSHEKWTLTPREDDQPGDVSWESDAFSQSKFADGLHADDETYTGQAPDASAKCPPDGAPVHRTIELTVTKAADISGVSTATEFTGKINIWWECDGQPVSGRLTFNGSRASQP